MGKLTLRVAGFAAAFATPALVLAAEGHGGGGLPQLDTHSYPTQIFWALVFFALIYVLMSKVALPRVGEVLEERARKLDGDLDAARSMQADAAATTERYEEALGEAREKARDTLRAAADAAAADATAKENEFGAKLADQAAAAAERIDQARASAMAEMKTVAAELAKATAAKLASVDADDAKAKAAVDAVS